MLLFFSNTAPEIFLTHAGDFGGLAHPSCREPFPNLPSENGWIFSFALDDCGDDIRGEKPGSAPSNGLWLQESGASESVQDLTDAAVGHLKF